MQEIRETLTFLCSVDFNYACTVVVGKKTLPTLSEKNYRRNSVAPNKKNKVYF